MGPWAAEQTLPGGAEEKTVHFSAHPSLIGCRNNFIAY